MKAVLFIAFLLCSAAGWAQHVHYICQTGGGTTCSDANTEIQARSKATPWQHAPKEADATGNASSYSPVAGDSFVYRGCDTWMATNQSVFVNVNVSGSAGNFITWGGSDGTGSPDTTWYDSANCSSWSRPIFSGGGTWPGNNNANYKWFALPGSYINVYWIEFTNNLDSGTGYTTAIDWNVGSNLQTAYNYWHGMHASSLSGGGFSSGVASNSCGGGNSDSFHDNYFDLSDSSGLAQALWVGITTLCHPDIYRNYITGGPSPAGLGSCVVATMTTFHDNTLNYCGGNNNGSPPNGLHQNVMEGLGDVAPNGSLYYNNLIENVFGASPIQFSFGPPNSSATTGYAFNNVFVNTASAGAVFSCSNNNNASNASGSCINFNNTVEGGNDPSPTAPCFQNGDKGPPNPIDDTLYNHCVTGAGSAYVLKNGSTISSTGDLIQTYSIANGQGYSAANFFAPQSGAAGTVGTGGAASTMQAYCTTIGSVFGAQYKTACQSDTTLGVTINTTTHQVTGLGRSTNLRPTTGSWDVGAYEFSGATKPNPPVLFYMWGF